MPHPKLFGLILLFFLAAVNYWLRQSTDLQQLNSGYLQLTGMVIGLPQQHHHMASFSFQSPRGRLNVRWSKPKAALKPGQIWQLSLTILNTQGSYRQWLLKSGFVGSAMVIQYKPQHLIVDHYWARPIDRLRTALRTKLHQLIGYDTQYPIILALILGDREHFTRETWRVFQNTGTSHLVAISGLHVGLVTTLCYALARYGPIGWLNWRAIPSQVWDTLFALLGACVYSALAGFAMTTIRALIMLSLAGVLRLSGWGFYSIEIWLIAAFIIALFHPAGWLKIGTWLSFWAVGCLIYTGAGRLRIKRHWSHHLTTHVTIAIGMLPVVIYCFGMLPLTEVLANLVAIPAITLLAVPLIIFALLVWPLSADLAKDLFGLINTVLNLLWHYLHILASQTHWILYFAKPSLLVFFLASIGVLLILAPRGFAYRPLGWILLLPLFHPAQHHVQPGEMQCQILSFSGRSVFTLKTTHHKLMILPAGRALSNYVQSRELIPELAKQSTQAFDIIVGQPQSWQLAFASGPNTQWLRNYQKAKAWIWDGQTFRLTQGGGKKWHHCQISQYSQNRWHTLTSGIHDQKCCP